ncbi:MAG TPA: hypothetical protein VFQ38_24230 [Longimicrobiales bacterium]|nr:hypothetical protein [Longimicrobiales bacterium]
MGACWAAAPQRAAAQGAGAGEDAVAARAGTDTLPGTLAVRRLEGGPTVVVYPQAPEPLVAVRASFALDTATAQAEALADILQRLARRGMEGQAAAAGGRVTLSRTPGHAVVTVTGPAGELRALVDVIRRGVAWREPSEAEVEAARLTAATAALATEETPEAALRLRVLASLFPLLPTEPGAVPPRQWVTPERLHSFWARSFRPERMQAVVVGGVSEEEATAAFRAWPAPQLADDGAAATDATAGQGTPAPARSERVPQVLFPWAAAGFPSDASPAVLAVTARLLEGRLAALPLRTARAEVWWQGGDRAVVLEGSAAATPSPVRAAAPIRAAPPPKASRPSSARGARRVRPAAGAAPSPPPARDTMPNPGALLATAPREVAALLTPAWVAEARQSVARDILLAGRTAEGLAGYLGELFERTGHPTAGQEFLHELEGVDAEAVGQVIDAFRSGTPVVEVVRP